MVAGTTAPTVGGKITAAMYGQLSGFVSSFAHGEWTFSVSVPNASLTSLAAGSTAVTSMSSTNIASFVSTTASGFSPSVSGLYLVTLQANLTVGATGRSFVSISSSLTAPDYRASTTVEDILLVTAVMYITAGASVTFQFFQTTTATRVVTGRFNISFLGAL